MADLKTKPNRRRSVAAFIKRAQPETRREDCARLLEIMREETGEEPVMWGEGIVGFGNYHYTYSSGREGDWFLVGFAPRKRDLTVYIMAGFDRYEKLLAKLGKHKKSVSCLYLKKLADVDEATLRTLIRRSAEHVAAHGGC